MAEPLERRIHARIEADLPCTVTVGDSAHAGRIRNLSESGALVAAPEGIVGIGGRLSLAMEIPDEAGLLHVDGEVVRTVRRGSEHCLGVRLIVDDLARAVDLVLALLACRGIDGRDNPRVYRRVPVVCRTKEETSAVLDNISGGGLALECAEPVEIGDTMRVELQLGEAPAVEIRGYVVHAREIGTDLHHVGLRFEYDSDEERRAVDDLIARMLEA